MQCSAENSSGESTGDENAVLMVNKGPKIVAPFMMRGKLNDRKFAAIIDSGSPITVFPRDELKEDFYSDRFGHMITRYMYI